MTWSRRCQSRVCAFLSVCEAMDSRAEDRSWDHKSLTAIQSQPVKFAVYHTIRKQSFICRLIDETSVSHQPQNAHRARINGTLTKCITQCAEFILIIFVLLDFADVRFFSFLTTKWEMLCSIQMKHFIRHVIVSHDSPCVPCAGEEERKTNQKSMHNVPTVAALRCTLHAVHSLLILLLYIYTFYVFLCVDSPHRMEWLVRIVMNRHYVLIRNDIGRDMIWHS